MRKPDPTTIALIANDLFDLTVLLSFVAMLAVYAALASGA